MVALGHASVQIGDALRLSVQTLITSTHLLGEEGNGAHVTIDVDRQRPTQNLGTVDVAHTLGFLVIIVCLFVLEQGHHLFDHGDDHGEVNVLCR